MAKVEIVESLFRQIEAKFKSKAHDIIDLLYAVEENPHKGKVLGSVGGILIKELKYENFRFYFITDGFKLKCLGEKELIDLLLRFVRMSDKKQQQQTIGEIKHILRIIGASGFF
ncbi:hypothetical protein J4210_00890 [Candidatus Woesearchaeota archaeon]|nr:hypothetical protein [Candidatus Woesearchaeota archaeon]